MAGNKMEIEDIGYVFKLFTVSLGEKDIHPINT